jgi:hypothetical protein
MEVSNHVGLVKVSEFVSYLQSGRGSGEAVASVESHLKAGCASKQFGGETDSLEKSTFKLTDTKTGLRGHFLHADGTLVVEEVMGSPHNGGTELGIPCKRQQVSFCDLDLLGERPGFCQPQPNFVNAWSQNIGSVEILIGERVERDAEKLPSREGIEEDGESKDVPGGGKA